MPKLKVDGIEVEVPAGATVLQAGQAAGREILHVLNRNFPRGDSDGRLVHDQEGSGVIRRFLTIGAIVGAAALVSAGNAFASEPGKPALVERRVVIAEFGDCAYKAAPALSAKLLASEPGTPQERKYAETLVLSRTPCLAGRPVLSMATSAIRGAVAEAAFRRAPGLLDKEAGAPSAAAARVVTGLQDEPFVIAYAHCLVDAAPAKVAAIFKTAETTPEERGAVIALGNSLSDCMATDVAYHINIGDLRAHLAAALYLRAVDAPTQG